MLCFIISLLTLFLTIKIRWLKNNFFPFFERQAKNISVRLETSVKAEQRGNSVSFCCSLCYRHIYQANISLLVCFIYMFFILYTTVFSSYRVNLSAGVSVVGSIFQACMEQHVVVTVLPFAKTYAFRTDSLHASQISCSVINKFYQCMSCFASRTTVYCLLCLTLVFISLNLTQLENNDAFIHFT